MAASNKPRIRAYVGATGSGKGVSVSEYLAETKPERLIVWDPQAEWGHLGRTYTDLATAIKAMAAPSFRIVFYPGPDARAFADRFSLWCRAVYAAGNCTALVEELADVTTASHAPPAWRRLNTSGRHRGLEVIGCTQRPAFVDKAFLGGCTYIRCFTLRHDADKKCMASALGVAYQLIDGLQTIEHDDGATINAYERDFRTGQRGEITIKKGGAARRKR
jgi:hypothetical protein